MVNFLYKLLTSLLIVGVVFGVAGVGAVLWGLHHYGRGLPEYHQLADYEPPTLTRLHAGDGRLLAEYATEKRVFVPVAAMPKLLIKAFIAAEDQNFYHHFGVDPVGVVRAAIQNLANVGTSQRLIGASTITQQVAKNFLLTNEVSYERKIKEALLAMRMERALSKDRILELYLNEIFLGQRSYGVAAAAINYFNKSLSDLTLSEMAYLAALPKGPNNYHPVRNAEAAHARRDYVVRRMFEDGFITREDMLAAMDEQIVMQPRDADQFVVAPAFAEEVRREIAARYGEEALYEGGLSVRTTVDPTLQLIADEVLRDGLIAYDRRHGWRGAVAQISIDGAWADALAAVEPPRGLDDWRLAVVLDVGKEKVDIGLTDGTVAEVPMSTMTWARPWLKDQRFGNKPSRPDQVVSAGDVVVVEAVPPEDESDQAEGVEDAEAAATAVGDNISVPPAHYALRQVPNIEGGLIALDPHTGRVLAMSGGWSFDGSQFNRVTQAMRQPGSAFKPFVYLTALERGYTPASLILDAPFVIDQGPGLGKWKPQNYSNDFYGPSTIRVGIEKSRNVMTVRLAHTIGIEAIQEIADRFGIGMFPPNLSMSLGSGETTLMKMAGAYAMLVNGGKRITPAIIERIQDRHGRTIYRRDTRACDHCVGGASLQSGVPRLPDTRERVTDPATAFQMTWILKGVVDRGTGRRIAALNRPLAGKTGTTNDSFDAWWMGFSPDLVVGVYIGFDNPRTLGKKETGSSVAVPVFKAFMERALGGKPPVPFRIPPGIRMVRIDGHSGKLPGPATERIILEAFKPGSEPASATRVGGVAETANPPQVGAMPAFDSDLY